MQCQLIIKDILVGHCLVLCNPCKLRPKKKALVSGPSLASIFGGNKKNRGEYKYRGKKTKMEINVQNVFYLVVYRLSIS